MAAKSPSELHAEKKTAAQKVAQEETEPKAAQEETGPTVDPALVRQKQLQQQLQNTHEQIHELSKKKSLIEWELLQQKSIIDDMIKAAVQQADRLTGALSEIAHQQGKQKG